MSWETRDYEAGDSDLKPGYTVQEPITPSIERGFEVPRGGDDELLQLIDSWQGEGAADIAESYNQRGEDLLESFLDRHEADFGDTKARRFREYLHALDSFGESYAETGGLTGVPQKMRHLLFTQIVPIVKTVLRSHVRQKQARGGRDAIPGRATEARDERAQIDKHQVGLRVESEIRLMGEFNRLNTILSASLSGLNIEDEIRMHSARKAVVKRRMFLWSEENKVHQGAFNGVLKRLDKEYRDTSKALDGALAQLHGVGYAAAQASVDRGAKPPRPWSKGRRKGPPPVPDKMPGSPWRKTGAQSASRISREESLTAERSSRMYFDEADQPLGDKRSGMTVTETYIPFLKARQLGGTGRTLAQGDPFEIHEQYSEGIGAPPRLVPSRSPSAPLRIRGGGAGDPSPPAERKEKPKPKPVPRVDLTAKPDPPRVEDPRDPFYPAGQDRIRVSDWGADFRQSVDQIEVDGKRVSFVLPFKADPIVYQFAYGVKARDVVDLFNTYHRGVDYVHTVKALLEVMTSSDESLQLDSQLPPTVQRAEKREVRRDWRGRTLRGILQSGVVGRKDPQKATHIDIDNLTQKQAFKLIGGGKPGVRPKKKEAPNPKERASKVRPRGILVDMYEAWRVSAAGRRAKYDNIDALQLFSYHTGHAQGLGRYARSGSSTVERVPKEFREGVEELNANRHTLKLLGGLFGSKAGDNAFSPYFWSLKLDEQVKLMQADTSSKGGYKPNNWVRVLEAYDAMPKGVKEQPANASYSPGDRLLLWTAVSTIMRSFISDSGVSSQHAGDYLAQYAAAYHKPSPSPEPDEGEVPYKDRYSRRSRTRSPEDPASGYSEEEEEEQAEAGGARKKRKKRIRTQGDVEKAASDFHGYKNFPLPGSYPNQPVGSHLFAEFQKLVDKTRGGQVLRGKSGSTGQYIEGNLKTTLERLYKRRHTEHDNPSKYEIYRNLVNNAKNEDKKSFQTYLEKVGWNDYVERLSDGLFGQPDASWKKIYMFDVTKLPGKEDWRKFLYEEVFRAEDQDEVADLLQKWVASRIWNENTRQGRTDVDAKNNFKRTLSEKYAHVRANYVALEKAWRTAGKWDQFPVKDWEARLDFGNQLTQLDQIYPKVAANKERMHANYVYNPAKSPRDSRARARLAAAEMPEEKQGVASPWKGRAPQPPRKMLRPAVPKAPVVKAAVSVKREHLERGQAAIAAEQARAKELLGELMRGEPDVEANTYTDAEGLLQLDDIEADLAEYREAREQQQRELEDADIIVERDPSPPPPPVLMPPPQMPDDALARREIADARQHYAWPDPLQQAVGAHEEAEKIYDEELLLQLQKDLLAAARGDAGA